MEKVSDSTLVSIKIVRGITYVVYGFTVIAVLSITIAFFLLLFGANIETPFVKFIYELAFDFGQPFRGIFPTKAVGQTGYFSASALFAAIMYLVFGVAVSSFISYLNLKMTKHEQELKELTKQKK